MTQIEVKDLTVAFEGKTVFKNLSFNVKKGDYLCILGENGSGKTTLMRCILGLLTKHGGEVKYNGFTKDEIGWLPQRSQAERDFPAGVFEVVLSGFAGKNKLGIRYSSKQRAKALENMKLMEITELKNRSFKELSGGQQQKVLLCRALCAAKSVLLLDEPVTGLDAASQNELYGRVDLLNRNGMTVIMITHDISRSVAYADNILHLSEDSYYFGTAENYVKTGYYKNMTEAK